MFRSIVSAIAIGAMALAAVAAEGVEVNAAVEGSNAFACGLYGQLTKMEKGNIFFSPASIHAALGMAYAGARGRTAEQMGGVLHLEPSGALEAFSRFFDALRSPATYPLKADVGRGTGSPRTPGGRIILANALWGQRGYPWKDDFLRALDIHFRAGLRQVDFKGSPEEARAEINRWVEQQTREKIHDLLAPGSLGPLTRLVLTNAAYFKDGWMAPFPVVRTRREPFHAAEGGGIQTPMMHHAARYGYLEAAGWKALEMPYAGNDFSMVVFLPDGPSGLGSLEQSWASGTLLERLNTLAETLVEVALPKFSAAGVFSLSEALSRMGMSDAFTSEADFTGMTSAERPFISQVIHKAVVEVDEKGSEAAATTAVRLVGAAFIQEKPKPKEFIANHPFLFLIRHRPTGAILFMGRLMNP